MNEPAGDAPSVFTRWASGVHRHRGRVLAGTLALLAAALWLLLQGGALTTGTIDGIEAARAESLARGAAAGSNDQTLAVIFHRDDWTAEDPRFTQAVTQVLARVGRLPEVESVVSPVDAPPAIRARFVAKTGHDLLALVRLKGGEREATAAFPAVREALEDPRFQTTLTGKVAFLDALNQLLEHDLLRAELLSFPLALVVLLWVFRTVVAAVLPLVVGGLAVLCGVAGVLLLSRYTNMAQYTLNVVSLIGLGVAIDYSLFIVSRFRAELAAGLTTERALMRTLDTAGRAVAFSGLAVAVGLGGLLFFRGSYLSAMGLGGALVVAFAVLFALTVLPALLSWLGPRVDRGRLPFTRGAGRGGLWHALATWVMRHPWWVLLPTLALLLAMGLPFRRLELAATDITALPEDTPARQGAERLARLFPREAATRVLVAVEFPSGNPLTPERAGALFDASRRIAALPGVLGVESAVDLVPGMDRATVQRLAAAPPQAMPPELAASRAAYLTGSVAVMQVLTSAPPSSREARDLVRTLRENRVVGDGRWVVGGQTATDVDAGAFVRHHTPAAVGFVMGMTCLVLFVLLRSVVLPLKALLMNVLSLAGSFGALVWIFQEGHLHRLLRFEPGPIEPSLPILLFCALFGLSMDYEVLLLSRIREEWLRTGDNTHAVAEGLERTGGLITSAAAIMVAVFAAFSLASVVVVKAMGVGMAIAVALDATLVRVLIVPAMMRLMGDLNWWGPGHRGRPHVRAEGTEVRP
ncbi:MULTISPECIES: MMPL family transporter [Corallococcus]|uniref:MMPL family transporter n=1 Tax=Corallococcus TaxID=83461 RepID=UPI00117F4237|nr:MULTISPECIES: MMPL family transporter [Corallococcus]NBD08234.1 MMPL family transporter [Corallococcus silvisoli]TSC34198.1 MMPL family transporter [Corallococcus sp. Z5C101001]